MLQGLLSQQAATDSEPRTASAFDAMLSQVAKDGSVLHFKAFPIHGQVRNAPLVNQQTNRHLQNKNRT
jgi:hypothetical protein